MKMVSFWYDNILVAYKFLQISIEYFHYRHQQGISDGQSPSFSIREPMMIQPAHNKDEVFGFEDYEEFEEPKIQRDDLRNPFWIEDKEVLNGPRGHLKTEEIEFWKGNILNFSIIILLKV